MAVWSNTLCQMIHTQKFAFGRRRRLEEVDNNLQTPVIDLDDVDATPATDAQDGRKLATATQPMQSQPHGNGRSRGRSNPLARRSAKQMTRGLKQWKINSAVWEDGSPLRYNPSRDSLELWLFEVGCRERVLCHPRQLVN